MCEPELVIDINVEIPLPYDSRYKSYLIEINNEKKYRLRTSHIKEIENEYFDYEKCNKAYNIIMKYLDENNKNTGNERREYVGRLFNLLTWMLNSEYSLMFKKDIRLRHLFSYADHRAENFISQLTSENMIQCPLLSILINYRQVWSLHTSDRSRLLSILK